MYLAEIVRIVTEVLEEFKSQFSALGLRVEITEQEFVQGDLELEIAIHRFQDEYFDIASVQEDPELTEEELREWLTDFFAQVVSACARDE